MSDQNPNNPNSSEQNPFVPPEGADAPDISEIERERGDLWDELDKKNWPPGRIQEELDKQFPLPKTPEEVEEEEKKAIARNLGATALEKPKPKRRKYKRRPRDPKGGGPPPHIAKQLRKDLGLE